MKMFFRALECVALVNSSFLSNLYSKASQWSEIYSERSAWPPVKNQILTGGQERKIFWEPEISYREWHIVDIAYRETIVSRVDSACENLMEIHDYCL